ncbi:imidazoleglycerol-phosphate dehydratase HisB [Elusimicrobiota bacterium]
MRKADVERNTKETQIKIAVNLDGTGKYSVNTPNGFLTHMLELMSKHSGIDMEIEVRGDTEIDLHHTVEDTGIVLGEAVAKALGDKKGIERYASIMMPMDEVRVDVAIDLGGRCSLMYTASQLNMNNEYAKEQGFDYSLIKEFMKAFSDNAQTTLHIDHKQYAPTENKHHIAEAIFKGLARTLKQAVRISGVDIPSTKGVI